MKKVYLLNLILGILFSFLIFIFEDDINNTYFVYNIIIILISLNLISLSKIKYSIIRFTLFSLLFLFLAGTIWGLIEGMGYHLIEGKSDPFDFFEKYYLSVSLIYFLGLNFSMVNSSCITSRLYKTNIAASLCIFIIIFCNYFW